MDQSARAAEYTKCISTEEKNFSNECPGYDTKQSDGEVPEYLFISIAPMSTLARSGSTW